MPLKINQELTPRKLLPQINRLFDLSARKILSLEQTWREGRGAPVFTVRGKYTSRGWTEWTQGFQYGSALLQFDATGDKTFLELGRRKTIQAMARHVSHTGVHDHGFNNISTYGNLWRLMGEGRITFNQRELEFYELALKISGAVQAARWTETAEGGGFIYSFNGPHSLFIDTMRSLRSLAVAHLLGHALLGERDRNISLLQRLLDHAESTARYNIYYGKGRDAYDVRGRTAHETIFNLNDGGYRCPSSQQGYSPFSTWMRGLAWGLLGFAEQLEFLNWHCNRPPRKLPGRAKSPKRPAQNPPPSLGPSLDRFTEAAGATADFYLAHCCSDGVPMWDTAAPNLYRLKDYLNGPADPFNPWEPVDSSASVIAAQGLLRFGAFLAQRGNRTTATRYRQAALTIAHTVLNEPYLSTERRHQGLLLHSVYHRPNGWDYIAPGQKIPNGESSIWGDYHLRELALMLRREAHSEPALTFFAPAGRLPD